MPQRLILPGILLLFLSIDVRLCIAVLGAQPPGVDWSPLWAAARLPVADAGWLYDFARITRAQAPLIGHVSGLRPFVYPPSALPLFVGFALLPVLPSYALWTAATGGFFLAASARLTRSWWVLPLLPPVILVALTGQTSFLLGGMMILGLLLFERRPACAGLVLGLATAIKPQLFLLVPVALMMARNWRALRHWALGGAIAVLVASILFGPGVWLDWLAALPRFQALFQSSPTLIDDAITPYALAERIGIAGWWALVPATAVALLATWATFRRDAGVPERLIALFGGALLLSPYAMDYELALLAPAVVAGVRGPRGAVLLLVLGLSVPFGLGIWGLAAAMLSLAAGRLPRFPASRPAPAPA